MICVEAGVPMLKEWQMAAPVDFTLGQNEHLAIVGRNGSGKSKLVDILIGKHPLKGGKITYDFASHTRKYVSENVKYLAFKDCYGGETDQNYYLQQRWNQWNVDDERILMSSGELRKYSLSKVLNQTPCVLIMDNPFVGLDVASRKVLNEQLKAIIDGGATHLVLVLSRTDEVPPFITHVVRVEEEVVLPKLTYSQWKEMDHEPDQSLFAGLDEKFARALEATNSGATAESVQRLRGKGGNDPVGDEIARLNKVSIRYGERTILKDLDWVVRKGEHWSLMGPNGSGKSTLLGLVCADNPQSYACDISLFGWKRGSGESIWDIKKHIGYVSPELHRSCKRDIMAERIVANGLRDFHGMFTKANDVEVEIARKWLELFGIVHLAQKTFLTMSSGEQRLVLLARAFVRNPDLLILDEPFHGLDNTNRDMVKHIIGLFCQDASKTLVMVTHYPEELPSCIDHNLTLEVH